MLFSDQVMSDSLATPWVLAHQAPLSMGFFSQECWSGLPFLLPVDLPSCIDRWVSVSLFFFFLPPSHHGRPNHDQMFGIFCPVTHPSERREGLETELVISHGSDEAYIKIPKLQNPESLWADEYDYMPGGWLSSASWGKKLLCPGPFQVSPCVSLYLDVYLYCVV